MRIAIGSDHGGFELKKKLAEHLRAKKEDVSDLGTFTKDAVDYPDIAAIVALEVAKGNFACGILIDGTGIGSAIAANKIKGIRAASCANTLMASSAREHGNANILVIGAGVVGEALAKEITDIFISRSFAGGRHAMRLEKIAKLENANLKEIERYTSPPKKLVTADDVRTAKMNGESVLYHQKGAIITAAAKDAAHDLDIRLVERT